MRFMQLTLILLCLLMPPAMAQDETKAPPLVETEDEAKAETEAEADTEETLANPGKYQASEQISDDLSVSFPVDI